MISLNPITYLKNRDILHCLLATIYDKIRSRVCILPATNNPFRSNMLFGKIANEVVYQKIIDALANKSELMMGRFGACEHDALVSTLLYDKGILTNQTKFYKKLCNNAGFFSFSSHDINTDLERFSEVYLSATSQCDIFGVWSGKLGFEEYFLKKYAQQDITLTQMGFFGPNIHEEVPFTYALKETNVLVIHPFAQTIKSQYQKYDKLFTNKKILPKFNIKTFKAIQTAGGEIDHRFKDWFEALEWMGDEISKIDFDIALIGCGAYGFPLAARIKQMGKIAIHCGGNLQLLFGIKGKRWEIEQPEIGKELFNKYWVYPSKEETISNASKIEGGCYW